MGNYGSIIAIVCLINCLVNCFLRRTKNEILEKFHRTEEVIVTDELIRKYEQEHQKVCDEEIEGDDYLEWFDLDNKDLTNYCTKYLQHSTPEKIIDAATGITVQGTLHYEKGNTNITNKVIIVKCILQYEHQIMFYYMTRAPEPNCVYALKSTKCEKELVVSIIHKYCNFEDKPLINMSPKRKKMDLVCKMHRRTGQPIAKDEYLMEYELEHQEMYKRERADTILEWLNEIQRESLDSYCYKYMRQCVPGRSRKGLIGIRKIENLHYQKLNAKKDIKIRIVTCLPINASGRQYHITRASENNCVYALLRKHHIVKSPFLIIFKHCDFDDLSEKQTISQDDTLDRTVIPKSEVKKEMGFDIFETKHFFSTD